jgi:predicted transcriptional regulator YdeE
MVATVSLAQVRRRKLAAVHRQTTISGIASTWRPALDLVWQFLRTQPALHTDGHSIFLYRHPSRRDAPMDVEFGVEVTSDFAAAGEVHAAEAPQGEVAMAVHIGAYDRLHETHDAIHAWTRAQGRSFAGWSWEIYGDWTDDSSKLETAVLYLLV